MTMGTKIGTKAFGQTSDKPLSTNALPTSVAAQDKDKIGGENVGEVLNKIADPNFVDPSKKMRTTGNPNLDKDAFFKLMIAQMKNQDPTNPMKPHELSAQLANFSSLEQMTNMNKTLTEMKEGQKPTEQFQALGLIGKAVSGDSAKLVRTKGDRDHDFRFNLPRAATEVTVKIRNSEGDVVRTYELKNLKEGANKISWNGMDDKGQSQRPDEYTFSAEAKEASGQKLAVKTDFEGVITGVNYTPEGPVLLVGSQTIRMSDVKKIVDAGLMKNGQIAKDVTGQDLKTTNDSTQTEKGTPAAEDSPKAKSNIMDSVGLSREMLTKLAKETAPVK